MSDFVSNPPRSQSQLQQELMESLQAYLESVVAPIANQMDRDPLALEQGLRGLGDLGIFRLRIPIALGGLAASETIFCLCLEQIARYSGTLAFLQIQHQSAIAQLLRSSNAVLKQTYLTQLGAGKLYWGIGFSHLRRSGSPVLQAQPIRGGYELTGAVPWLTGVDLFQAVIVAAVLPDGQFLFGRIPFCNAQQPNGGRMTLSEPMSLAVMTATCTVSATFDHWLLTNADLVSTTASDWIDNNDRQNLLQASWLAMGCARAGLDIIADQLQHKSLDVIALALTDLTQELDTCRHQILQTQQYAGEITPETLEHPLKLRAWSIDLAVRCAHAAVTVVGGAANDQNHPAQRIYREALMFTVTGETSPIMAAILNRLTRPALL